jgi:hypothetical protein
MALSLPQDASKEVQTHLLAELISWEVLETERLAHTLRED